MAEASHIPQIVGGVIGLLMIAAAILVLTRRLTFPFTVALVLIGAGLSLSVKMFPHFVPSLRDLEISPALILYVFLPVINKIDLAPHVGASLDVMRRDSLRMRGARPFVFTNLKDGTGVADVIKWLEEKLSVPANERRVIIDAHAAYVGTPHSHDHSH